MIKIDEHILFFIRNMEGLLLFLGEIKESNVRLDGRMVIITGSNTGIGFYAAF
jgi:hypothetical protein